MQWLKLSICLASPPLTSKPPYTTQSQDIRPSITSNLKPGTHSPTSRCTARLTIFPVHSYDPHLAASYQQSKSPRPLLPLLASTERIAHDDNDPRLLHTVFPIWYVFKRLEHLVHSNRDLLFAHSAIRHRLLIHLANRHQLLESRV